MHAHTNQTRTGLPDTTLPRIDPLILSLLLPLNTKTPTHLDQRTRRSLLRSLVWGVEAGAGPSPPLCPECGHGNELRGLVPVVPSVSRPRPSPLLTCPTSHTQLGWALGQGRAGFSGVGGVNGSGIPKGHGRLLTVRLGCPGVKASWGSVPAACPPPQISSPTASGPWRDVSSKEREGHFRYGHTQAEMPTPFIP